MLGRLQQLSWLVLCGVLVACSTSSVNTEVTRCVYPDSPRTPAPEFICGAQIAGFPMTALRSAPPSVESTQDRISAVVEDQIAQWQAEWVNAWFIDTDLQHKAERFLAQWLAEHSRVVRSRISPKDNLWLLIGLPKTLSELEQLTRDAVLSD